MPFDLFCDRRLEQLTKAEGCVTLVVDSPVGFASRLVLRRKGSATPKTLKVESASGPSHPLLETADRIEFEIPAGKGAVTITW